MKELLTTIAKGLVEAPDQVMVDEDEPNEEGVIVYHIHVAEDDMGCLLYTSTRFFHLSLKGAMKITKKQ